MGVTIHYRLQSAAPDTEQARDVVKELRSRALDLPFENVGEMVELVGGHCDFERLDGEHPHRWLLIQAQPLVTDPLEPARHFHAVPLHVIAFSCWPGPDVNPPISASAATRKQSKSAAWTIRAVAVSKPGCTIGPGRASARRSTPGIASTAGHATSAAVTWPSSICCNTPSRSAFWRRSMTRPGTGTIGE